MRSPEDDRGNGAERALLDRAASLSAAGDRSGAEAALTRLLDLDPLSIPAHIRKARSRMDMGDEESARMLLDRALRLAERGRLSATEQADVSWARGALAGWRERADTARRERLKTRQLPEESWSPRFRHAIDLAAGRRKLYAPDPTAFTYPGLPHEQFHDPGAFEWASGVEAATASILGELTELLRTRADAFRAYVQTDAGAGPLGGNAALVDNADWSVLRLCENGWLSPELVERCPRTWDAVLRAPVPRIAGWGPTIVFSLLKAGARIAPHTGMVNTRLICHLPLIVPPGCGFRVGDEVREWEVGKLMIFDDTIEHEAWNESREDRVVLIFDIWRPELSERERRELTALFSD